MGDKDGAGERVMGERVRVRVMGLHVLLWCAVACVCGFSL